jgi:hypothetical protein
MSDRDDLVAELARVSHETYMRQAEREGRDPLAYGPDPTDHDRERAEDIVQEFERRGLYDATGKPLLIDHTLLDEDGETILAHGQFMCRAIPASWFEASGGGSVDLGDGRQGTLTFRVRWQD